MPLKPFTSEDDENPALPRAEFVYRQLRSAILEGGLPAGTRLREIELAQQMEVSRTPVREALRRLESEGMVTADRARGLIVTELTGEMVRELYAMREMLEGTAAAWAARNATAVELAALRTIADQDAALVGDPLRLARNNHLFHQTLYRAAHNRYLLKSLSSLQASIALLGSTGLAAGQRAHFAVSEHQALLAAIERHDARSAEDIARSHIRGALEARMLVLGR
ncbi:GntR family transcriptional regulator [Paraburkholderia unamae]|uniref:GntR family transcriptional regulator n=1 Tax=Paraburkholderia unamae TaxID=219649 RepID=A0ABX5KHZ0_9BURK|nr:GntR family transcriptional regulator [Paraburkholderia unamae]PVX75731.1 GntR family transcriptional regulator [Paraburkholderia unamae]RAR57934.1 GntR family transcriptional regulator [Paraburkholderia unamae]CAG9259746.1 GntR family transcriptional regulator [Paraburkholderia unamae]